MYFVSFLKKSAQDIMCKIKNWVIDEKKPVRFYHDWNDKEVGYTVTSCIKSNVALNFLKYHTFKFNTSK